jgi:hypothetical protein
LITYRLDPEKFPRVRRNILLTYGLLGLVGLGIGYLNLREALFGSAWPLIPFVLSTFFIVGVIAVRQRKKNWETFQIIISDNTLVYAVPKMREFALKRSEITGVRQVRQGLIVSTRLRKNALLISKDLRDADLLAIRRILEQWAERNR